MPEQQQQSQDTSQNILWMGGFLIGVIFVAWYFGQVYIAKAIFQVRYYEIVGIHFFVSLWLKFSVLVGLPVYPKNYSLPDILNIITEHYGSAVDFNLLYGISVSVGNFLRFPVAIILTLCAICIYFTGVARKLKHIFDTKSLKLLEQENWPQIAPVAKLDLVNTKLDDGPWAMALTPMNFCKKHDLLDVEYKEGRYFAKLKKGPAYRLFALQLGPKWTSPEVLPIYLKALFAIFAARIAGDKKAADAMLDQISASAKTSKLNFHGVEELMRKYMNHKKVQKITILHGYVTSVLASLLVGARELGVLASSEFIWLKPIDRRMWYILNSVGRQTSVSEIAGAFSHWLAEKKIGLPLVVPMVDEAVRGMEQALSEIIYKPDEKD